MNCRLGTLLLIVTVCATLGGWVKSRIDARDAMANAEREFDRIRGGVRIEAEVRRLLDFFKLCDPELTDSVEEPRLRHELAFAMWNLYYYEARIDLAYPGDNHPTQHGHGILTALDCATADEFFAFARKLYDDPEHWPEYFDTTDVEYVGYRDFVIRSSNEGGGG